MKLFRKKHTQLNEVEFKSSETYWKNRYKNNGNSGAGSYNKLAEFKNQIINEFIKKENIENVIDFGCGDGNQISGIKINNYLGFDISENAVERCKVKYKNDSSRQFHLLVNYNNKKSELVISLDVLFHLVEDNVFIDYMKRLFRAAEKYVIIYSSNFNDLNNNTAKHVRHRDFTTWVNDNITDFTLIETIKNKYPYKGDVVTGSFSNFYIYKKNTAS